jgi:hypothetical protein
MTKKKEFTFPPQEEIERVIKRMTQPGYRRINKGLKSNATTEEKIKYNLCKSIVRHAIKNNLTEEKITKKLKVDQEKLEYILFCHIDKLNFEELTSYVDSLHIPLEIKINNQYGQERNNSAIRTH